MVKPTFKAQPMQVQVPATSANLGPGFDSLGLALGMHDRYVAQILDDSNIDVDVTGEGANDVPRNDKNLVDNVAAAIYGGATIAWQEQQYGAKVSLSVNMEVDARIGAVAFISSNAVATAKARKMLPETIPHSDAVKNSTNTSLLVHALTKRPDLLFTATEDFLHQRYRKEAMPQSFALLTKLRSAGVAAFISGAGPTLLVLHTGGAAEVAEMERAAGEKFTVSALSISRTGASVISA